MTDLLNQKLEIKSFKLSQGKTSWKYIGVILIIALIFIGLMWLGAKESGDTVKKEFSETEKELKLQEQVSEIIKTKDFTQCDKINDATNKTVCVNNIALNLAQEKQDVSYCQKIDDKLIPRAECKWQIVSTKALEKENIEVCKEAQNKEIQTQCAANFYNSLALKKNDIEICNQLKDNEKTDNCYNTFLIVKDFTRDSGKFDCLVLRGNAIQKDCKKVQEFIKTRKGNICAEVKNPLFLPFCLSARF